MADEEKCQAEPRPQIGEQRQHLRLHRHVERRDRLVGDQKLRRRCERAGQPDALALAAGELVRIAPRVLGREANLRQQRRDPRRAARRAGRDDGWPARPPPARRRAGADRGSRTGPGTPAASAAAVRGRRRGFAVEPARARHSAAADRAAAARSCSCRSRIRRPVPPPRRVRSRATRPSPPAPGAPRAGQPRGGEMLAQALGRDQHRHASSRQRRQRVAPPRLRLHQRRRGCVAAGRAQRAAGGEGAAGRQRVRRRNGAGDRLRQRAVLAAERSPAAPACRGAAGARRAPLRRPCSTIWPAYITATRSAISATMARLWVMNTSAMPRSRRRSASRSSTCAWMVTSSAVGRLIGDQQARVVGDRHRHHRALAHSAREFVREGAGAAPGSGMPTRRSRATTAVAAPRGERRRCARSASVS